MAYQPEQQKQPSSGGRRKLIASTMPPQLAARLTSGSGGGGGSIVGSCAGNSNHNGGGSGGGRMSQPALLTPLQTLQKLEISKHRAEKALAATGNRDAQSAVDWLLAHAHDASLDEPTRREYILYACPTGAFLEQLERFWVRTRNEFGWNGAHNFVPHITLVSFFQAPDEYAPQLSDALRLAVDMAAASCANSNNGGSGADGNGGGASLLDGRRPLSLELNGSDNFLGFYVRDRECNDANMLQRLSLQYVQNVKEVLGELISDKYEQLDALVTCFPWCGGVTNTQCIPRSSRSISLEPHDNKLHLTLAYKFAADQQQLLHTAATADLDANAATQWELRLYSRDPLLAAAAASTTHAPLAVHRVLNAHQADAGAADELSLRAGDFVYVSGDAANGDGGGADEWAEAVCVRTGCAGLVAMSNIERTAESDAWTLHQTVSIAAPAPAPQPPSQQQVATGLKPLSAEWPDVSMIRQLIRQSALRDLAAVDDTETEAAIQRVRSKQQQQQLYVLRHGERVDFTFSPDWHLHAFDADGAYRRRDLNKPPVLPERRGAPGSWRLDGPLTEMGCHQAWLTGRALRDAGVPPFRNVYCSPAFRCIQTCASMLDGMRGDDEVKNGEGGGLIRVEPSLFEWLVWHANVKQTGGDENGGVIVERSDDGYPEWMEPAELRAAGYDVDVGYVPMLSADEVRDRWAENCGEFYARNNAAIERAVAQSGTGNILCVGHAVTLDSCTKQLTTGTGRTYADMMKIMPRVAYASLVMAERQPEDGGWRLQAPPAHGMTHNRNARFDWKALLLEESTPQA